MPSSKKTALLLICTALVSIVAIVAFLLLFPKKEIEDRQPEAPSQEVPPETIPKPTTIDSSPNTETNSKSASSIEGSSWEWKETTKNNTTTRPEKSGVFVLTFLDNSHFGITTDCNRMGGTYAANTSSETEGTLSFSIQFSSEMACAKTSQEQDFSSQLVASRTFSLNDTLLTLASENSATMIFSRIENTEK